MNLPMLNYEGFVGQASDETNLVADDSLNALGQIIESIQLSTNDYAYRVVFLSSKV